LGLGILPCGAARNSWQAKRQSRANFQAKPDRFLPGVLKTTLGCGVAVAGIYKLLILNFLYEFWAQSCRIIGLTVLKVLFITTQIVVEKVDRDFPTK